VTSNACFHRGRNAQGLIIVSENAEFGPLDVQTQCAGRTLARAKIELCGAGVTLITGMFALIVGALKWAAVGFVVAFVLMKLYEGSHIHDDIPRPDFKVRQSRRAALVLSVFAGMLSGLVWLLVQTLD
jgi:hypothetical protein